MTSENTASAATGEWVDGKYVFELSKPLPDPERPGETIKSITLREPDGSDMVETGNPVDFNPVAFPPTVKINDRNMAAMICRLAMLPPSVIGKMAPKDMINVGWVLAPFFVPV